MIPYAFATVTLLVVCFTSDKYNHKGLPLMLCLCCTSVGFVMLLGTTNKVALVAGTCFVASGLYPGIVLTVSWITINHSGYTKRSTAWAMAQITGQGLSIIGTQVYRHGPRFLSGHGTLLGFFTLAEFAVVANYWWMRRENRKKERQAEIHEREGTKWVEQEMSMDDLLDNHPDFRYIL
jgi:hypothetical protein